MLQCKYSTYIYTFYKQVCSHVDLMVNTKESFVSVFFTSASVEEWVKPEKVIRSVAIIEVNMHFNCLFITSFVSSGHSDSACFEMIICSPESSSRWDCVLHVWKYKLTQTLSSFTSTQWFALADWRAGCSFTAPLSRTPYDTWKQYHITNFFSAREMWLKEKLLIHQIPEQSFSHSTILVTSSETSERWIKLKS